MASAPYHAVVWLVTEHGHVPAANKAGKSFQIFTERHTTRGVVRAVQEDGARARIVGQKRLHVLQVRPEIVRRLKTGQHHSGIAAENVGRVGGKVRAEHENAVACVEKRLAEQLFEIFCARSRDDVLRGGGHAVLALHILGRRGAKLGNAKRRTVSAIAGANRLDPRLDGLWRRRERTVSYLELDDVLAVGNQPLGDGQNTECGFHTHRTGESAERRHAGESYLKRVAIWGGGEVSSRERCRRWLLRSARTPRRA